jgi:hypothetical protein
MNSECHYELSFWTKLRRPCYLSKIDHDIKIRSRKQRTHIGREGYLGAAKWKEEKLLWNMWNSSWQYVLLLLLYSVYNMFNILLIVVVINCSIDCWGAMLQAGRSCRLLISSLIFFTAPNTFSRTMAQEFTQSLTEFSTIGFLGTKSLNHHLWADCLENVRSSTSHNPIGLHSLLRG